MARRGWTSTLVSEICRLQNGRGFKPEEWDTRGLPIIRIQNLNGGTQYNFFSGTPEEDWLVYPGQMLFAWAGTKGVSFGPTIWKGEKGVLNQHIFKVFPRSRIDEKWLYYCLQRVTKRIESKAHGFKATLVHVKKSEIDNQVVLLPPLAEQRLISTALTTWDRAIDTIDRAIQNSEAKQKALMQRLFSPFGKPFRRLPLREIASVNRYSLDNKTPSNYSFRYISLSDVQNGRIATSLETHVFGSAPSRAQRKIRTGDILMSTVRPNLLGFARITDSHADCIASTGFATLSTSTGFDPAYLYHYLFSAHIRGQLNALVVGSNYPAINPSDVENLVVYCPELSQQNMIGRILDCAAAEINMLGRYREQLNLEKTALMQQLLSGKRRIKIDELLVEVIA